MESSPPPGLTPSPGSQTPSQMMVRTNHGSISVRMKLITPSVGDSDRYSGNGFGTVARTGPEHRPTIDFSAILPW